MKRFLISTLGAGALVALSQGAAQAAPACGLSNGKPATGAPIVLGADVTASGGADMSSAPKGAKAYFDCVNANGGINGRPIVYSWLDDQTRPDKAAENAKKLVEDGKAAALVGGASIVDCIATAQYFKGENIISLMGGGVAPPCFTATNVATINAGPRYSLVAAVEYAAKNLHIKHIVCPQPTFPGAEWICDGIKIYADLAGIKFSTFTFDQTSPDNDSLVAQILATGADATVYVGTPVTAVPFLVAAEHGGLGDKMVVLAPSPVYNPAIPRAIGPYWNDKLYVNLEFGPLDADGADTKNFLEVMKGYGGPIDPFSQMGYLAARVAVQGLLAADPGKLDRAGVTAAIQKVQNFKSDMLCADWSFGGADDTHRLSNRAGWMAVMHDNAWQVKAGCTEIDPRVIK